MNVYNRCERMNIMWGEHETIHTRFEIVSMQCPTVRHYLVEF